MTVSGGAAPRSAPEPPSAGADPAQALGKLGRSWTWMLGSALTAFVPGVLILVWPDETLHVLGVLVGLYLLVMGGFRFVASFAREDLGERLPGLLLAVLYVLAGVLCMRNPLQTVAALSLIVGVVWLVSGILTLYTAIVAGDLPHRGFLLGAAVIGILAGIVVLALPTESARALTRLLGLWLVLLALVEVVIAIAWRAAVKRGCDPSPALQRVLETACVQGPAVEAHRTARAADGHTPGDEGPRWPEFTAHLRQAGYAFATAVPMRLRKETIGSLLLLDSSERPLTADDLALAQALADAATIGLLHSRTIQQQDTVNEQLHTALQSRIVIEQAKGLLAARSNTTLNDAFEAMRRHARQHRILLSAVAREVIDTGAVPGGRPPAVPPRQDTDAE
ncbi:ANTAR domain-containing protein [Streptomyces apricus]|uniref:ANTAR domain-containing protein n=1 Tax=Streptomyces apricus TaxID=1828112 RepID=A0A5B0BKG4_9ACTN|nr:ANTAR domain-containing protein [Streptomyces apricus]